MSHHTALAFIKNPKEEMTVYSWKEWGGPGNVESRADQILARKGGHTYHAYWEKSGRLNWKLVSPKRAKEMHETASRGGWNGAEYCRNLLAHAEMIRQGKRTFEGFAL